MQYERLFHFRQISRAPCGRRRATGATLPLPVCMHDEEWQR
jgi:hypothetical protein